MALVDGLGNHARFVFLPGRRHDSVGVKPLLDGISIGTLIGDKGFDNDWLRRELDERGVVAFIPPGPVARCTSLATSPCMDGAI